MASVAVLGAGISGLTAAYYLAQQAKQSAAGLIKKVYLLEQSSRCGGWIASTRFEDGAVYEHGPHSIRTGTSACESLLMLLQQLGMKDDILPARRGNGANQRLLCVNDKLYPLMTQMSEVALKLPPFKERPLAALWRERRIPKGSGEDESVDSFFRRRFGQEIADLLVGSMCAGIYAGDSRLLGMKACFPKVFETEQQLGSVTKGLLFGDLLHMARSSDPDDNMASFFGKDIAGKSVILNENLPAFTFRHGLESLPERLLEAVLQDSQSNSNIVSVHMNTSVTQIRLQADSSHETTAHIETDDGQHLQVDHVLSALPDYAVAQVLAGNGADVAKLCTLLGQSPFVDVAVVNLEYAGDIPKARGFGYLIPPIEQSPLLGVIFDSSFAPALDAGADSKEADGPITTRVTAMLGGSWFNERLGPNIDETQLLQIAIENVARHLHVPTPPVREKVRILRRCIPTYTVGHADRVKSIMSIVEENDLPVSFMGASYDGVSVTDIVHKAMKSCKRLSRKLEQAQVNVSARHASV